MPIAAEPIPAPDLDVVQSTTRSTFKGKLESRDIDRFVQAMTGPKTATVPARICSYLVGPFVVFSCEVTVEGHDWEFDMRAWGAGPAEGRGTLASVYAQWNDFFREVTAYHAQGIREGGGILQINFFNNKGVPVGQYNGVAGGISVFECGGTGKWHKK